VVKGFSEYAKLMPLRVWAVIRTFHNFFWNHRW
jgi:hypothetical protein